MGLRKAIIRLDILNTILRFGTCCAMFDNVPKDVVIVDIRKGTQTLRLLLASEEWKDGREWSDAPEVNLVCTTMCDSAWATGQAVD